jgi:rsbT co-antagonist protein RsbR
LVQNGAEAGSDNAVARVLQQHDRDLLKDWVATQSRMMSASGTISAAELEAQCSEFLTMLRRATEGGIASVIGAAWDPVRDFLGGVSRSRAMQGFSPSETANFVFSLKTPLFDYLRREHGADAEGFADSVIAVSRMLDSLGLYTTEMFQRSREEVIARQQQDMMELSTPVVSLWDGILALPMIGTLDSARTQVVMETLLQRIVETGADIAVIDITGVPTVDTLTAQHLLKTVTAARLMGAECIISGIRPQIAQTIVHLGVDLGNVVTKASLADAFRLALQRTGRSVIRTPASAASGGGQGSGGQGSQGGQGSGAGQNRG